jgi:ATP-dependent protease Clp ATPase subunit
MGAMDSDSFVLVLTNGTHVIDAANAQLLNQAIERRQPAVDISLDLHGDGVRQTLVRIITSHVVMLIPERNATRADDEYFGILSGKVHRLPI